MSGLLHCKHTFQIVRSLCNTIHIKKLIRRSVYSYIVSQGARVTIMVSNGFFPKLGVGGPARENSECS